MHPSVITLGFAQMLAFSLWFGVDHALAHWSLEQGHNALQTQMLGAAGLIGFLIGCVGLSLSGCFRQLAAKPVLFLCYLLASCLSASLLNPGIDLSFALLLRLLTGASLGIATVYAIDHAVRLSATSPAKALAWVLGFSFAGALWQSLGPLFVPDSWTNSITSAAILGLVAAMSTVLIPLMPVNRQSTTPPSWLVSVCTPELRHLSAGFGLSLAQVIGFITVLPALGYYLPYPEPVSGSPLLMLPPLLALFLGMMSSSELAKHMRSSTLAKSVLGLSGWCALIIPQIASSGNLLLSVVILSIWAAALGASLLPQLLLLMHQRSIAWSWYLIQWLALGFGAAVIVQLLMRAYVDDIGAYVCVFLTPLAVYASYSIKWHMDAIAGLDQSQQSA